MTLHINALPLTQIDTTLIDLSQYHAIVKEARRLSVLVRERVMYVIGVAYENANDTIMDERQATPAEWPQLFKGTMASFSVDALDNRKRADAIAKRWFARRGIQG